MTQRWPFAARVYSSLKQAELLHSMQMGGTLIGHHHQHVAEIFFQELSNFHVGWELCTSKTFSSSLLRVTLWVFLFSFFLLNSLLSGVCMGCHLVQFLWCVPAGFCNVLWIFSCWFFVNISEELFTLWHLGYLIDSVCVAVCKGKYCWTQWFIVKPVHEPKLWHFVTFAV